MIKKESRQFYISVEGINCEKMYFEHLAKLINSSDATYNLKVDPRKMTPMQYAKRNAHRPVENGREIKCCLTSMSRTSRIITASSTERYFMG